jgi:hypothetical protein
MKKLALDILIDTTAIAGASAIVYGAYQISEPAAWIAGGFLLLAAALHLVIGSKA